MKNLYKVSACLTGLLLAGACFAEAPAVLRDKVLTIPDAVVLEGDDMRHYRDIRLSVDDEGKLQLVSAEEGRLANVESVEVNTETGTEGTIEVTASGYKSSCVSEMNSSVTTAEEGYLIVITETDPGDVVCALVAEPFEIVSRIDVSAREPGSYLIQVNRMRVELML